MVGLDGEKMSKTLGNLVFVSGLRADGVDPAVIRVALLGHHYRSDWEWTAAELRRGRASDRRLAIRAARPRRTVRREPAGVWFGRGSPTTWTRLVRWRQVDEWAARAAAGERPDPAAPGLIRHLLDTLLGVASPRLASPIRA